MPLLNAHFKVNPFFSFYDDGGTGNAQADPKRYAKAHPDGAVLMGLTLAQSLFEHDEAALCAVLAHEWGHIQQFKRNQRFVWSVRYELDADTRAGEYFRTRFADEALAERIAQLFLQPRFSDYEFTRFDHHGMPNQRADSFRAGYGIETGISRRGPLEKK